MAATLVQAAFALCLILAALEDAWRLRISNIFPLLLTALFLVAAGLQEFDLDWLSHFGAAVLVFAAGLFMFARGMLGGGDVKLWTAMSLWMGLERLAPFTLTVVFAGGVLALMLIVVRRSLPLPADGQSRAPLFRRQGPIPYGLALCAGGLLMLQGLLPL
jgi:prepilin peptidase CpaA